MGVGDGQGLGLGLGLGWDWEKRGFDVIDVTGRTGWGLMYVQRLIWKVEVPYYNWGTKYTLYFP